MQEYDNIFSQPTNPQPIRKTWTISFKNQKNNQKTVQQQVEESYSYSQQSQQDEQQEQEEQQNQFVTKRSWHQKLDTLVNPDEMKKGKFSQEESEYIMSIVHKYQQEHNLSDQELKDYIQLKTFGLSKIWLTITKFIPRRTVDSVYKFIRRRFDDTNRKGYWSKYEEEQLNKYVNQYGFKWREISKHIHRFPDNIRNKFNQMGEQNFRFREKTFWTIGEFIIFIEKLQQLSGYTILIDQHINKLINKYGSDYEQVRFRINYRKQNEHDKSTFIFVKSLITLPISLGITIKWTDIAREIKTKTKDDIRQLFSKL